MTIDASKKQYLDAMGITVWLPRMAVNTRLATIEENTDWRILRERVAACVQCGLCQSRTQTVFGTGLETADVMVIGEAPGFHEDQQGQPFVGRAGQLLDAMLKAVQLTRADIFITNMVKCRPPDNRDPQPEEIAACLPYLQQQITRVQPKLIVAVGRIAAQALLSCQTPLGKLRGQAQVYQGIPLWVTYHPAYLLRNPIVKRQAYVDWREIARAALRTPV